MSATPDLDALAARVEKKLGEYGAVLFPDLADLIRDLLTYATTVRHELDDADAALTEERLVRDRATQLYDQAQAELATVRQERDEAMADCKNFWKLRAELAERQVASLTAQLAEARAAVESQR